MIKIKKKVIKKTPSISSNPEPDSGTDRSHTEKDSNTTKLQDPKKGQDKFDKPKKLVGPDKIQYKKIKETISKFSPSAPAKSNSERR